MNFAKFPAMKRPALSLLLSLCVFSTAWSAGPAKTYPVDFQTKFQNAARAFAKRDFERAQALALEADKVVPNTTIVWNLRGAIAIERGRYDEAEVDLRHALENDPKHYPAIFNLTEIPFRQKKYAEAREAMEKMLTANPKDELVQYRIYLSYLFEGNEPQAKATLDKIVFPANTPAYYYAQAAWALKHGDQKEAASWLKSSARVFKPVQNELFASSLREVGLLPALPPPSSEGL
jgi:tetratricopeptide (TPR) repeat protein